MFCAFVLTLLCYPVTYDCDMIFIVETRRNSTLHQALCKSWKGATEIFATKQKFGYQALAHTFTSGTYNSRASEHQFKWQSQRDLTIHNLCENIVIGYEMNPKMFLIEIRYEPQFIPSSWCGQSNALKS